MQSHWGKYYILESFNCSLFCLLIGYLEVSFVVNIPTIVQKSIIRNLLSKSLYSCFIVGIKNNHYCSSKYSMLKAYSKEY